MVAAREVTTQLRRRRYQGLIGIARVEPDALIASKKECVVASVIVRQDHWSADIRPKLILVQLVDAGYRIPGIKRAIANKLPTLTVKFVRARLGHNVHHPAENTSKLRLIVVRVDLEFLDIIDDGRNRVCATKAFLIVQSV